MESTIPAAPLVNPPEHSIEQQHIENPSHKGKKYLFIAVIIVVVVLIVGSGSYFLGTQKNSIPKEIRQDEHIIATPINSAPTPTSTPTPTIDTGEKTFQGQSFSFQYPQDWVVLQSDNSYVSLQKTEMIIPDGGVSPQAVKNTLTIYSGTIQPSITLDDWFESRYLIQKDKNTSDLTKQLSKKTTLGGINAISVELPGAGGYLDQGTVSIYNGKGYDISIKGVSTPTNIQTYQSVLTSFKFLNSSTGY